MEKRRVDDVRMADNPADIRGRPVHLAGPGIVDVRHRPLERNRMPSVVADDALRPAGRARRVEDVEGIGRLDRDAGHRLGVAKRLLPLDVAGRVELRLELRALEDDTPRGLALYEPDRGVEQRLVRDDAPGLEAAGGGDHDLRLRVLEPTRQLVRREAAEDNRVDRTDPRTRQHCDQRLRHHRHIDDDAVAPLHAEAAQGPGETGNDLGELGIRVDRLRPGERRVIDQRRLVPAPPLDVTVKRVPARVQPPAREPAEERRPRVVEDALPRLDPVDRGRRLRPERLRVVKRPTIDRVEPLRPDHARTPPTTHPMRVANQMTPRGWG